MSQSKTWKLFAEHLGSTAEADESNDVAFTFSNDAQDEQTSVKANRGLLTLLSPVFKSMFNNGMKESLDNNSIQIKDADFKSFTLFIQYFYGMDPKITASNIGILSYLAEKYLVSGLQACCGLFLSESISIDNLIPILESLHKHHQNKLFENCKVWMNCQSSSDAIINMFKSDAFMNTPSVIVSILLSGFGAVIDATILWECTVKWSQTKGTGKNKDEVDNKDDEKSEEDEPHQIKNKLVSIRQHFPFYRLPIEVICNQVLPLNILTKEMGLEVLTHKTYGCQHQLVQYCVSHKSLCFPKIEMQSYQFGKNKEKYAIETKSSFEYTVSYTNNAVIFFANVPMKSNEKWSWEIFFNRKVENNNEYFGIDSVDNIAFPGKSSTNSWGMNADLNRIYPCVNNSNRPSSAIGIKTGDMVRLEFDGPCTQLRFYLNGKALYCFNEVKSDQPLYPSFCLRTTATIVTVRNLRRF